MRHLAALLLLKAGGNANPTAEDITNLLSTVGVDVDAERLTQLLSDLEGKDIAELIAEGQKRLVVAGGVAAPAGAAPAAAGAAPAAGKAAEPEKPKVEEVDALDGGMDMFGGGGGGGGDY